MPDIRTQIEVNTIINNAQKTLATIGLEVVNEEKAGITTDDTLHRDKVYRMILIDVILFNIMDPYGNVLNFYKANTVKFNNILTGLQSLI